MTEPGRILEHGIRQIQIQHERAVWCIHCNCFINLAEPEHEPFCPYRALELAQSELARLQALVKKQRAVVEAANEIGPIAIDGCDCGNCRAEQKMRMAIAALDQSAEAGEEP